MSLTAAIEKAVSSYREDTLRSWRVECTDRGLDKRELHSKAMMALRLISPGLSEKARAAYTERHLCDNPNVLEYFLAFADHIAAAMKAAKEANAAAEAVFENMRALRLQKAALARKKKRTAKLAKVAAKPKAKPRKTAKKPARKPARKRGR